MSSSTDSTERARPLRRAADRAPWRARWYPRRRSIGPANYGRTLVGRLLVALFATAVVIYLAAVGGLWLTGGGLIEDSARKQALQWLGELDELGTPLYASSIGNEQVQRALDSRLVGFPQIEYVRYYDDTGTRLLGQYGKVQPGAAALDAALRAPLPDGDGARPYRLTSLGSARVRVTAPLQVHRLAPDALLDLGDKDGQESVRVIGYLDFVFDAGEERVQFQRSLIGGSLALALVLCVAVVYGRYQIKRAMAPLTALEEPLARIARGDTNVDIGGGGDREIAAIREALNSTLAALKQRDEALRRAQSDALTGLVNQRYFEHELTLECTRLSRGSESSAVLCIDVDRFREVNEGIGPAAGDRLLGQVAGLLRARIRENDSLARLDGDEFVALARRVNRDGAMKVGRSINQVLQEFQFAAGEQTFPITVSIGIAMLDQGADPEVVLARARAACAEAKARGGNRHYLHEHDEADAAADTPGSAWSQHVRAGIQGDGLRFMYQPIVGLHGGDGEERYELLLRLEGPEGQLVSPAAFLPLVDRLGLTAEIDQWVIRRACQELAELRAQGRTPVFFVNLSGHAFEDGESLVRTVSEALAHHGVEGERLVFEVTEQAAVLHLRQARVAMERLREIGCRFALDDFGTGFSSLSYLKHLPAAFIKISGAFVQHLGADAIDKVMVHSIVQLAQAMHMQTVAESVEDRDALKRVIDLGVDFAQGHVLARPAEQPAGQTFFAANRGRRLLGPRSARLASGSGGRAPRHS